MKNKYNPLLPALLTLTLATGAVHAQENFILQADDAAGASSFSGALNFRIGNVIGGTQVAPTAGNTYQTGARRLRTLDNALSYTFEGDSLEIQAGLGWRIKNSGTNTVNNLILADTAVVELTRPNANNSAGAVGTLAGNITLSSGTAIFLAGNNGDVAGHTFTVSSTISGVGGITTGNSAIALGGTSVATSNGTVILTGDNSFTGGIASNGTAASRLRLGNANAVKNSTVTVTTGGLTFSSGIGSFNLGGLAGAQNIALADTASAAVTLNVGGGINNNTSVYDGVLSGSGANLIKSGTGMLTLTNANTYTGATTINGGTLKVNTSTSISTSSSVIVGDSGSVGAVLDVTASGFTVGAAQTLSGIGVVSADPAGLVTVGGTISAGNSGVGTLSFDGGILTLNGSTKFNFDLGTSSDLVTLMNGASLDLGSSLIGFSDFTFSNAGGLSAGTYTLIGGASSFTGGLDVANLSGTFAGFESSLGMSGNNLVLTVIPEPNTAALLGGLGVVGLLRRRRN